MQFKTQHNGTQIKIELCQSCQESVFRSVTVSLV